MTPNQRDKAAVELTWLWSDYPGACAPHSILYKMMYGLLTKRLVEGTSVADIMTQMHADALDMRFALGSLSGRDQSILHLSFHPSSGPPCRAVDRIRSRYYRQGGSARQRTERLERAGEALTFALAAFVAARGIR